MNSHPAGEAATACVLALAMLLYVGAWLALPVALLWWLLK